MFVQCPVASVLADSKRPPQSRDVAYLVHSAVPLVYMIKICFRQCWGSREPEYVASYRSVLLVVGKSEHPQTPDISARTPLQEDEVELGIIASHPFDTGTSSAAREQ